MLANIQPEVYHKKARSQLEDVKHNFKLLHRITQQLDSLTQNMSKTDCDVTLDKSEKIKIEIRQKLKSMSSNVQQMITVLDYKLTIICRQLSTLQKNNRNCNSGTLLNTKTIHKIQQPLKYQINQLQQQIFELHKKQNQYVKQISELKERNVKLRQDFSNLSFDSNQRIKELSEKLHNNTSPNLTIKRINGGANPQTSYVSTFQEIQNKKGKNNFVKIKGGNIDQEINHLERSPPDYKKNKILQDSFTSQYSQFDVKGLGYQIPQFEQTSGKLKFGCFPTKQISQKTKTGSSSQNKKLNLEDKNDKNRRFQFLLNNLTDNQRSIQQNCITPKESLYQPSNTGTYQYKGIFNRDIKSEQFKSVFDQKAIKRYQI